MEKYAIFSNFVLSMTLKGFFIMPNHLSAIKGDVVEVARKSVKERIKQWQKN